MPNHRHGREYDADARFHAIRDGDAPCCICGNPSYTVAGRLVYCFKHDPIRHLQTTEDEQKEKSNG